MSAGSTAVVFWWLLTEIDGQCQYKQEPDQTQQNRYDAAPSARTYRCRNLSPPLSKRHAHVWHFQVAEECNPQNLFCALTHPLVVTDEARIEEVLIHEA